MNEKEEQSTQQPDEAIEIKEEDAPIVNGTNIPNLYSDEFRVVFLYTPFTPLQQLFQLTVLAFQFLEATHVQFQPQGFFTSKYISSQTALIVDIGHDVLQVIPVCEGVIVPHAIQKSYLGG